MPKLFTKTLSALTAGLCMFSAVSLPSVIPSAQVYAVDFMESDTVDGYYYEFWNQNCTGEFEYENTENNGFTLNWSGIENSVALKGEKFERNNVYASQIKEYTVTYDEDVDYMDGNGFSGIYGWMEDSNAYYKFYIVDSWGSWRPVMENALGSFESNGITYDIYNGRLSSMTDYWGGNIPPTTYIYYSVARDNLAEKTDGVCNIKNTINVADHFRKWQNSGLDLGFVYDVGFSVHAYRSAGSARINSIEITKEITEENNYGPQFTYNKHDPLPTDEEGRKVFVNFETENEMAGAPFEGTEAIYDTDHSFSGEHSMLISGEDQAKRAFEFKIDPYDFDGRELLAGLKLYQNSGKNIKFIFQLIDLNSKSNYSNNMYSRTIPSGVWTDVENLQFLLFNNNFADGVLRIVSEEPVDFCVDDFYLADSIDIRDKLAKKEHAVLGDVNGDGSVDIYDVIVVRRLLLMADEYNVNFYQDVNGDCKLNISDLVALNQFVLGKTKQLPEHEKERVYFADVFNETVGNVEFNAHSVEDNVGEIKSAVCSDSSFITQWSEKIFYKMASSQKLENYDELTLKYSGTAKADSCDLSSKESSIEITVEAEFKNDYDKVRFIIEYGASEDERLRWNTDPDDMKLVEIGGKEYYIDKNEDLPDEIESDRFIYLYPKEDSVKNDEVCNFDVEIDFSELLKYFGKEEFNPDLVEFSFKTEDTKGFFELEELSCTDKSKAD